MTLYTFACGEVCQNAEALLNRRGVPFTTVNVEDPKGAEQLKTLTGEHQAPVLQVGDKLIVKGFNEARWQAMLDEAGYPKTPAPTRRAQPLRPRRRRAAAADARSRRPVAAAPDAAAAATRSSTGPRRTACRRAAGAPAVPPRSVAAAATRVKLATWNVNSLNVRLPRLLDWLAAAQPGRASACRKPSSRTRSSRAARSRPRATPRTSPGRRRTTASRSWCAQACGRPTDVTHRAAGVRRRAEARDRRPPSATCASSASTCPTARRSTRDKYRYKLDWCARRDRVPAPPSSPRIRALAVVGDFNIAPEDRDVHDPAAWAGQVLCSDAERAVFRDWLALGLADSFRLFDQPREDVQLVGLPPARVPQEPRPAHRPHPAVAAARRALHARAGSTATRARARSRPTTRR